MQRKRTLAVISTLLLLGAFGIGASGLPGDALVAAVDYAMQQGWLELSGPVGDAVRGGLG